MMSDSEFPQVTLCGVTYSVPPIPFRFASKIIPILLNRPNVSTEGGLLEIATAVYSGLKSSHKELEYEAFIDQHFTLRSLLDALTVISKQAGLKDQPPGEAAGAMNPLPTSAS